MMQNNGYLWGAVLAVLIIIAGVFIFRAHQTSAPSTTASSTSMGTTTVDLGNGETVTLPPGVTLHEEDSTTTASGTVQPPSLTGDIVISATLAPDVQAALRTNEQTLITQLKAAPARIDLWLKLGTYRKIAGDYAGAQVAWQYVVNSGASNIAYIAYGDLGELNLDFLKNYPRAEADYKAAISLSPQSIDYYRELFLMYTTVYKTNTTAAADIVAQGLKANPNNPDLVQMRQQLQTKSN
jgi:tetratricopeptide (TPR) repeat protein